MEEFVSGRLLHRLGRRTKAAIVDGQIVDACIGRAVTTGVVENADFQLAGVERLEKAKRHIPVPIILDAVGDCRSLGSRGAAGIGGRVVQAVENAEVMRSTVLVSPAGAAGQALGAWGTAASGRASVAAGTVAAGAAMLAWGANIPYSMAQQIKPCKIEIKRGLNRLWRLKRKDWIMVFLHLGGCRYLATTTGGLASDARRASHCDIRLGSTSRGK